MSRQRRTYDSDFKRDAVKLSYEPDKTVKEVAHNLGIKAELLTKWRKDYRKQGILAFPGKGIEALTPEQKEIRELKKQLKDVQIERDILKKAVGIFSKAPKGGLSS